MIKGVVFLLVVYLVYTAVKSLILLRNGSQLIIANNGNGYYTLGNPKNPQLTYLVMGDSTAVGVGASSLERTYHYQVAKKIADKGNFVKVTNIAESGATVADVVAQQLPKIAEIKAKVISISIGGNDATHMTSHVSFEKNMKIIIAAFNESGAQTVLFGSTPNMFAIPALPRWFSHLAGVRSMAQNEATKQLLPENIAYIDIFNKARLQGLPDYANDWFHPNDKGYERWSKAFTEAMVRKGT